MEKHILDKVTKIQRDEITEYHIYSKLAKRTKDKVNKSKLKDIAEDELKHYNFWNEITKTDIKPRKWKIHFYYFVSIIFGLTFGMKLMEIGEEKDQDRYEELIEKFDGAEKLLNDDKDHEQELLNMLEEEKLNYVGSVVLGLNDALVELTGSLAGWSFALRNTRLIALTGLIMGIAASLSMGASEYLSKKANDNDVDAFKSCTYTTGAYIITVILLILPYFILESYMYALYSTILIAFIIILVFNYYVSVAKDLNFKERFLEMAGISLGVTVLSFLIGMLVRIVFGIEV